MNAMQMLEHYKSNGERVDEVLFNRISKELYHLRTVIEQKNFSIELIGEQKLQAQTENKRLREALEGIAEGDYTFIETLEIARKALEGDKHA